MGVTDEFLVKFNEKVSEKEIQKLHKKFGVEVVKSTDLYQLIKVPSGSDALEIANYYQESDLTHFSHPNFICEVELHQVIPNDPYFANQYSLNNTGQVFTDGHSGTNDADIDAPEAWSITQGNSNITIAVLDQGLTSNHPDLPNSRQVRLNGSNFADGDLNNPSPTADGNHGNACAGIIGATQNNNQGISGVAPNCKIMPVRVFNSDGSGITPQRLADAITFAQQNGAQIISNSWGYNSDNPNLYPVIRDAIIAATTQGRNGLGCIVVFSAGNNMENNGYVHFPSNVNISGVLTVGASDRYDLKAYYSPLGNPSSSNNQLIDIVAPSHRAYSCQIATETLEAWSIDIPEYSGYNPVHENDCGSLPGINTLLPNAGVNNLAYTGRFGGTSYSCPQVAAVAALVLSINPNLSQQQVFDILTTNADKAGGYAYINGRSNEMGFGRLNACSSVTKALFTTLSIAGPSQFCTQETYAVNNLPTGATVVWSAAPSYLVSIQQSGFTATLSKMYSGKITLTATITINNQNVIISKENIFVGSPMGLVISNISNLLDAGYSNYFKILPATGDYPYEGSLSLLDPAGATFNYEWSFSSSMPKKNIVYWWSDGNKVNVAAKTANAGAVLKCTATNNCGSSVSYYTFYTGNISQPPPPLFISPNPAVSEVNITFGESIINTENIDTEYDISIYNNYGKPVYKYKTKSNNTKVNVSGWQKGLYIVKISNNNQISEDKFFVQ